MIEEETKLEKDEKEKLFSIRTPFHLPCLMGNWNEDLFLKEEKTAFANYKQDRCQLILQKTRKMFRTLLKTIKLSHELNMIQYNENYQFIAPDIPYENSKSLLRSVYLSGVVTETEIDLNQRFNDGSLIVGSLSSSPCVRNTFRIIGCDRNKSGEPVLYGEDVLLQIADDAEIPLYIRCENTFEDMGYHLYLKLSRFNDIYSRFKILHFDPNLRFENEGNAIRSNDRVIIQHVPTGRNLAVENKMLITFFGNEYLISCHTYKDTHKMETAENIWKIVGEDLPDIHATFRAARGENVQD